MKIFISSLITGMEAERAAVKQAIELFGHQAIMAEDFGARASSPQVACLNGVREADLVMLILGPRYGAKQAGGVSATHEEVNEARNRKPLLMFVQSGMEAELDQAALIKEIGKWQGGQHWDGFVSADDLGPKATRAIHKFQLTQAVAPLDPAGLRDRALALFPRIERGYHQSGTVLQLAVAAGPDTTVLRPAEIEAQPLLDAMQKHALFGAPAVFDRSLGMKAGLDGEALVLVQEAQRSEGASIRLWPNGDVLISLPVPPPERGMGLSVVVEEDIAGKLEAAISYAAWLLAHIDPTERLSHVVPVVRLLGEHAGAWRTRAEHEASPNSMQVPYRQGEHQAPVLLSPAHRVRQSLSMDMQRIVEDLVVLLRRRWIN
ncbi:DUF4062 domain-containing protein [Xanthomonas hortorum pv. gardneri]|uniref:DUF4062 domain-containing protein n=1 Tax=Xanthomonas hortorum pv. vitians TaxID=83224 RepID=A0A6V7ES05_9XANT|nr:DUF4062 domain-containing protein [Xanthomonas hortorum]MCC8496011.1 DUF4062 domain-containing protein [Xanthomonas hortorum pv. gardneri]MCE4530603.1 DUF4062 domain-containing protein [Xanthomonas hortorum pv. vitians]MDT7826965.1 DUF4062 domain-containing protein [Xanthomonas hortorum pv. vitians]MDV7251304.1 DUF4062 domain-containing protein [Xanthomonas hortorum pv. vitians]NMI33406.1 DUF4062 domain-containing protein [Xanthomonas hortorum pv. vitians]